MWIFLSPFPLKLSRFIHVYIYIYIEKENMHRSKLNFLDNNSVIWVKNIDTKQSNKRNNQNCKSKRQDYHMKQGDTNDTTTWPSMKTRGKIRCSGRVSISCFACGTPHDISYVISMNKNFMIFSRMFYLSCQFILFARYTTSVKIRLR